MPVGITVKTPSVRRSITVVPNPVESRIHGIATAEPPTVPPLTPPVALPGIPVDEPKARRAQICVFHRGSYSIRVAESSAQHREAAMLVERMYSSRGYHTEVVTNLSHNSNRTTLLASNGPQLYGTLTLGFDAEEGLLADALYEPEINAFRETGHKLCELSSFAVDPQYSSQDLLAALFQLAYIYARMIRQATDVFIEVNPRHAGYYKRMLGFTQIGEIRTCPRVDAPAVLLHLELSYMDAQIRKHSGSFNSGKRSLYPYFLLGCANSECPETNACLNCSMFPVVAAGMPRCVMKKIDSADREERATTVGFQAKGRRI